MSVLRRRLHRKPGTIELTPLVDVALMLVVFLLLSSGMVAPEEQHLEIDLPVTASGEEGQLEALRLSIAADGRLYIDHRTLATDQLRDEVGEGRALVIIRADRRTEHGRVMEVIDELRRLGVGTIYHASDAGVDAW
ncbi:MAG: biopolymer transporter ExbD [Planctomycetota bacterium]|nr:MAG: biopolymer transporter ExbD [Planctomycetota bacterium]